ncbi:MAG TPA: OsmC family protein [Steroidobacteraceae bacterium]|nr:OsmC family protein [Steroidobacteraceae bacterium]
MSSGHSEHVAEIRWQRAPEEAFTDLRYSRAHQWQFDGGMRIAASSAVSSVPLPYSKPENVDPEEALVAAVSSCHMLMFLWLAARQGLIVDSYEDHAVGTLARNAQNRLAITQVQLAPRIAFSGARSPTEAQVEQLHHAAHEECYIANSVTASISVRGQWHHSVASP